MELNTETKPVQNAALPSQADQQQASESVIVVEEPQRERNGKAWFFAGLTGVAAGLATFWHSSKDAIHHYVKARADSEPFKTAISELMVEAPKSVTDNDSLRKLKEAWQNYAPEWEKAKRIAAEKGITEAGKIAEHVPNHIQQKWERILHLDALYKTDRGFFQLQEGRGKALAFTIGAMVGVGALVYTLVSMRAGAKDKQLENGNGHVAKVDSRREAEAAQAKATPAR